MTSQPPPSIPKRTRHPAILVGVILLFTLLILVPTIQTRQDRTGVLPVPTTGWSEVSSSTLQSSPTSAHALGIAANPSTNQWTIVGSVATRSGTSIVTRPAIWSGANGHDYRRIPDPALNLAGNGAVEGIASYGSLDVAVGGTTFPDRTSDLAIWTKSPTGPWALAATDSDIPGVQNGFLREVEGGTGGFIARGTATSLGISQTLLLLSQDGHQWFRVSLSPTLFNDNSDQISAVARLGSTVVLTGCKSCGDKGGSESAWISTNSGATWSLANFEGESSNAVEGTYGVIPIANGFVAVGYTSLPSGSYGAVVWMSTDGADWTPTLLPTPLDANGNPSTSATGYLVASSGSNIVVIGSSESRPTAWIETNGTWSLLKLPPSLSDTVIAGSERLTIAATANNLEVVGDRSGGPIIWGEAWDNNWLPVDPAPNAFGGVFSRLESDLNSAAVVKQTIVASGTQTVDAGGHRVDSQLLLTYKPDTGWREHYLGGSPFSNLSIVQVVAARNVFIAAASSGAGDSQRASVWYSSASGDDWTLASDNGAFSTGRSSIINSLIVWHGYVIAAGSVVRDDGTMAGAVWLSIDGGKTWKSVRDPTGVLGVSKEFDDVRNISVFGLCASKTRLYAVGSSITSGGYRPAIWTSSNGSAWRRSFVNPAAGPDIELGTMIACVANPAGRLVALANSSTDVTYHLFSSSNGVTWSHPVSGALTPSDSTSELAALSVTDGAFVVGGDIPNPAGVETQLWTSVDGSQWTAVRDSSNIFGTGSVTSILTIHPTSGGLLVTGYAGNEPAVALGH